MSGTIVFSHTHRSVGSIGDWTDVIGAVSWIPQGLNGGFGGLRVPFESATEASVIEDFVVSGNTTLWTRLCVAKRNLTVPAGESWKFAQWLRDAGTEEKASLSITRGSTGVYNITARVVDDSGSGASMLLPLPDSWPMTIEVLLLKAGTDALENGGIAVWFDGVEQGRLDFIDFFDGFDMDRFKLGHVGTAGGAGMYLDVDEVVCAIRPDPIGPPAIEPLPITLKLAMGLPRLLLPGRSGAVWNVEVSNAGDLWVQGPPYGTSVVAHEALYGQRRQLLDTSGISVWRVWVDDRIPHSPILEAVDLGATRIGHTDEITVHSSNGREWAIRVDSAGTLSATALSSDWPRVEHTPYIEIASTKEVIKVSVTDAGSVLVEAVPDPGSRQSMYIRSQDDTALFQVVFFREDNGDLTTGVINQTATINDHLFYDYRVTSPNGTKWHIQADHQGQLSAWNADAFEATRPHHTVALDSRGKLVLIDPRFKAAHQRKTGWGGRTFRGGKA